MMDQGDVTERLLMELADVLAARSAFREAADTQGTRIYLLREDLQGLGVQLPEDLV